MSVSMLPWLMPDSLRAVTQALCHRESREGYKQIFHQCSWFSFACYLFVISAIDHLSLKSSFHHLDFKLSCSSIYSALILLASIAFFMAIFEWCIKWFCSKQLCDMIWKSDLQADPLYTFKNLSQLLHYTIILN